MTGVTANRQLTLGGRIFIALAIVGCFLAASSGISVFTVVEMNKSLSNAMGVQVAKLDQMAALQYDAVDLLAHQRAVLMWAALSKWDRAEGFRTQLKAVSERMDRTMQSLAPKLETEAARRALDKVRRTKEEIGEQIVNWNSLLDARKLEDAGRVQYEQLVPRYASINEDTKAMVEAQSRLMAELKQHSEGEASMGRTLVTGLGILGLVVCGILSLVVRKANKSLRQLASEVAEGAQQVASASGQVAGASQALAQGSSEQAASLEQTSASTEEINSMTQKNTENARLASEETSAADRLLEETNTKLQQMMESMREINVSSEKISKIIKVIDEIAFQTNILALNAAVEAARAGEAGMGFAVVADEVRNLAQRCAQAAKDTSGLIEESIGRSTDGKVRLDEVAAVISRVVENASRIRVLANEVHVGSQEQARGIDQIAKAVSQMQNVTQSTAASAEESASAGEEMSAQAAGLKSAVDRLRVVVGSDDTRSTMHAAPPAHLSCRPALTRGNAIAKPATTARKAAARPATAKDAWKAIPLDDDFKDF